MPRIERHPVGTLVGRLIQGSRSDRVRGLLYRALGPLVEGRPVLTRYGVFLEAHFRDDTNRYAVQGYPDETVHRFCDGLREGDCFIDVGANQGVFTILAAKKVGPSGVVLAFEPQAEAFAALVRNAALNGVEPHMAQIALSDTEGLVSLGPANAAHSGARALGSGREYVHAGPFPRELLEAIGQRRVLIKIDCEGYELHVLRALETVLTGSNVEGVAVEVDERNLARFGASADALYELMRSYGFTPTRGRDGGHYDEVFVRPARA